MASLIAVPRSATGERRAAWGLIVGGILMTAVLQLVQRLDLAPLLLGVVCLFGYVLQRPGDRYLEPGALLSGFGLGTFLFHEGWLTGLVGEGAEIAGLGLGMLAVTWLQITPKRSAFGPLAIVYIGVNAMLFGSGVLPAGLSVLMFGTGAIWGLVPIVLGAVALRRT